jgi:transposase-like protein
MMRKEIRMSRGKRYSTEQIIGFLGEAEVLLRQGQKVCDVCLKLGISEQSYSRWRKTYGGLKMDQARQFKELERENARLRKAVSELTLDKMILNEALSGKY